MKKIILLLVVFSLILITALTGCGGGGGGKSPENPGTNPGGEDPGTDPGSGGSSPLQFSLNLSAGSYWEYYWSLKTTSYAQGSSTENVYTSGSFKVKLGSSITVNNLTAYRVTIEGTSSDGIFDYKPEWSYLAASDNKLYGSKDGSSFTVIFDGQTGTWQGGGFFTTFPADAKINAVSQTVNNEYINTSVYGIGRSASAGQAVYYPELGITIPPNDTQWSVTEKEYYKNGMGPVAYYFKSSTSSSGGEFYTYNAYERSLGLVNTSLTAADGFIPKYPPWVRKANMPVAIGKCAAAVINNEIYVLGNNSDNFLIYNPATDSWRSGTTPPVRLSEITCGVYSNKLYVFGISSSSPNGMTCLIYNPSSSSWIYGATSSTYVSFPGCGVFGPDFVIIGMNASHQTMDALIYRSGQNSWEKWPSCSTYLLRPGYAAYDRSIYIMGTWENKVFKGTHLRFYVDNATNPWYLQSSMPTGRTDLAAVALNGLIYAIGGYGNGDLRTVEAYNPSANYWNNKRNMLVAREGLAAVVCNGKIYAIGGTNDNISLGVIEEYDPARE